MRGRSYSRRAYSETGEQHMNHTDTCTTTTAVSTYGIDDGSDLIQRTHRELTDGTSETHASGVRFDELAAAFRTVFIELAGGAGVPGDVAAAIEDGLYFTREQYEGTDADLRTVVPAFYREVAGFLCAYH